MKNKSSIIKELNKICREERKEKVCPHGWKAIEYCKICNGEVLK